jgi:uncharacterized membrane protein YfcA
VGFGFSLLAVAFFLMIIGSSDAVPLLFIINLTISLTLVSRLRADLNRALWTRLVIGALLGLPVGLIAFSRADVDQLKVFAAIAIIGFVIVTAFRTPDEEGGSGPVSGFKTPSVIGVGAVAGGMTTSLGLPGPAVVLYLTAIGSGKDATRSITLTFFAISYGASLLLHTATVGVSKEVWITAGLLIPVAAMGAFVGHALGRRVSESAFRRLVLTLVASTGAYILLDTLLR